MSELLRVATAGSVDDGKSTLIGRLLYDSKAVFDDQVATIENVSRLQGADYLNLALLTDGLRAEREQGITIDVAYRYFATPKRKFVLADTPGHLEYTRNMVTGASNADLALLLIDVRRGVLEQSRRHAFIASLLRLPHIVVAVNKMDLVGYSQHAFDAVCAEFRDFASRLELPDLTFVPISALHGDNVVRRSANMPWYEGAALMHLLEHVYTASDRNLVDARFPVQYVIRPLSERHRDYRGYAGQVAGGVFRPGDEVVVLPSGFPTRIEAIDSADGPVAEAYPPMSVTLRLSDALDVGRGDMICRERNRPSVSQDLDAMICWLDGRALLRPGGRFMLKHTTRWARAIVRDLQYRIDLDTLHRDERAGELRLNEIGRATLRTTQPLLCDPYRRNRTTGSFILVDEATRATVAGGMLL
jgi:bifunctional enzyme CysN/CysC